MPEEGNQVGLEKIEEHRMALKFDGSLPIATGKSRMEKNWKNKTTTWSRLLCRLSEPVITSEAYAEYLKLPKADQDRIKDVGGFIGGTLKNGRRKADSVAERQLVTLDADYAPIGLLGGLDLDICGAYAVYSTHKHCPDKPRLRILIPLDRPVTPDEYEAIARKIAETIGVDYFDDTTYQPSRLMYWASVARDGEYIFDYDDTEWVRADEILARYPDWTDISYWPESSRTKDNRIKTAKKQGDPCEKQGLIGAFCRTYSIGEAIEQFLPDTYMPCAMPGRYTYAEGSTAAGLVLYDDKFAYSNHATDPAGGKLCNAFDLVRIHKFGPQDEEAAPDTATAKLPSYKSMIAMVQDDEGAKLTLGQEKKQQAMADFTDDNWLKGLEYDRAGAMKNSLNNVLHIVQYDPELKAVVFNQMADNLEIKGTVPWAHPGKFWRDADDAQLESYLASCYTEFSKAKILTAITKIADDRSYHPIREYLESLPEWDGALRVDRLLVDYLSAPDEEYTHEVTRKTLCAAVIRVMNPGCKFDTVLVLCGPQGVGKSTMAAKLGGEWFSDSISLTDTKDKTAAEKLQGNWIIEFGELAGLRKADERELKGFITRQDDKYRASYGRRVEPHPRQCIFIGTTNETEGYLNDTTGGRRYWPVDTPDIGKKKVWDLTQDDIGQIWAEVLHYVREGEKLTLSDGVQATAVARQKEAIQSDPRGEMVREYLEKKLPEGWQDMDIYERLEFLYGNELGAAPREGTQPRELVCYQEIWCECFKRELDDMESRDSYTIKRIMEKIDGWAQRGKRVRISLYGMQRVYEKIGDKPVDNLLTTPVTSDNL